MILKIIKFVLTDMVAQLQCDYSNQGHPTKLSTNLTNKLNCGDHPKFSRTNYPCNQAVHHKDNRFVVYFG